MEAIQPIIDFISSVGFPIAVCLICFWYINKQDIAHREENQKLTQVLENNTLAIQHLADKLEGISDE